jgi:hypothetical protein
LQLEQEKKHVTGRAVMQKIIRTFKTKNNYLRAIEYEKKHGDDTTYFQILQ